MLLGYLKIAVKTILRYRSYTLINVAGLALGMSCALLIFSLVKHHLSFDGFHRDGDRIYRFVTEQHRDQISYRYSVPNPFGKAFREDYTYGEKVARICTFSPPVISIEEDGKLKRYEEREVAFAEVEFFDIFHYPLIEGDISTALSQPRTAIVTKKIAAKYFGNESPINRIIRLDNRIDFAITGILEDIPENTDRKTEIYLSYSTLKEYNERFANEESWGGISSPMQCFVRLKPGVTPEEVEQVLPAYVKKYRPNNPNVHHYKLQPLGDIHFDPAYGGVMQKRNLWVLSFIGLFLIITACANFINLATAQAINRSKEVGVRKALGGVHGQLFWQFITETGLITVLAAIIATVLAVLALPYVNDWYQSQANLNPFSDWRLVLFIPALIVIVTFISGAYPGLILSRFPPVLALKGKLSSQRIGGFNMRRVLIVLQFFISQVLLISLIVILYQMRYAKQSDLGFHKEAMVMIPVGSQDEKMNALNRQLSQIPGVEHVSLCFSAPASEHSWRTSLKYNNRQKMKPFPLATGAVTINTFLPLPVTIEGRNLLPSDTANAFW
jgi:putative ABC transport system permease protein